MEELCHARGVVLESLLPYSPDLNPIEEAFAEMKGWMKKHNELQAGYPDFPGFLEAALRYMQHKAGNHFRSAGIMMDDE